MMTRAVLVALLLAGCSNAFKTDAVDEPDVWDADDTADTEADADADNDGYPLGEDCDDTDAAVKLAEGY
jgi:hypothetical protein